MQYNLNRILLIGVCGLFFLLYLILAWNNRFTPEDYLTAYWVNTKGVLGTIQYVMQTWNIRLFSLLMACLVTSYAQSSTALFLFNLVSLSFLITAIFLNMKAWMPKQESKLNILLYSILITSLFFFTTYTIGEVWFWCVSSVTYLWSLTLLLFAIHYTSTYVTNKNKLKLIPAGICWLLLGATYEILAIIATINLMALLLTSKRHKELLLFIGLCIIPLFITYISPGFEKRLIMFEGRSFFFAIKLTAYHLIEATCELFIYKIYYTIPFLLTLSPLFPLIHSKISTQLNYRSVILFLSLNLILFTFILSYSVGDIALNRTTFFSSVLLMILSVVCLSFLYNNFKKRITQTHFTAISITIFFILLFTLLDQYTTTNNYAKTVDERIQQINQLKESTSPIELLPLGASGMLYSAEIDSLPSTDKNIFVRDYFRLNRDIKTSTEY